VLPNVDCASIVVAPSRAAANRFIRDGGKAIVAFGRKANIPVHILPAPPGRPDQTCLTPASTTSTPLTTD
jgi:hypothetical protein